MDQLSQDVLARRLIRSADRAALATRLAADGVRGADWPYASLVLLAVDLDATPLLLLSDLAEHSRNIAGDDRVALLIDGTCGAVDPLAAPRLTLLGRAGATRDAHCRARYLARHPGAALYAGFKDFRLYRIAVERAHLVAGFGRIHWLERNQVTTEAPAALLSAEAEIIAQMNQDHAEAIDLLAVTSGGVDGDGWRMTGIDPEGCDLRRGGAVARVSFAEPVGDAAAVRRELVRLIDAARSRSRDGNAG